MRFALIATVAVLAVSASAKHSVPAAVEQGGKIKHATAGRKHRALRNTNTKANVARQLAAEDEGYWDRFLQADSSVTPGPTPPPTPGPTPPPTPGPTPPPTPGPTPPPTPGPTPPPTPPPTPIGECGVDIESTCQIAMPDGTTVECKDVPTEGPEECGDRTATYCYTITNTGEECGTVIKADRTRTATPPGAPDGTTTQDLLATFEGSLDLCPTESVQICEEETVSTCEEVCYETSVATEIEMPNGTTCLADDMYDFCTEPGCQVDVSTTCKVIMPDGTEVDCKEAMETPPEDCEDGENMIDVQYCYTIENIGKSCGDISKLERTRTTTPPGTSDTKDLLPELDTPTLCPGETATICEMEPMNTCIDACHETTVVVDATMPDGFVCSNADEYEVCTSPGCTVDVETSCTVAGTGTDCQAIESTPDDCGDTAVEYCYAISNPGTTCGDISTLTRTRTPPGGAEGTRDLIGLIPEADRTDFCPGESVTVCETVVIDTCDDQCYETTTEVAIDMEGGKTCEDTDLYELCVNPGCVTELEQTCKIEGSDVACEDIPPPSFEECADGENMLPVEQCYKVSNVGPTCGTITTFERTTNGETFNLIEGKPADSLVLCPGQDMEVCETNMINTCEEECYTTSVEVVLTMADESTCEETDEYEFCTPPPLDESCNVEVDLACSTEVNSTEDGSGSCDVIIPIATRCDKRAAAMTWRFNGGDCEQSFNIQEADKFVCTDFVEGGAPTSGSAWLTVASVKNPDDVYFDGEVLVGDLFTMFAADTLQGKFDADSTFSIYADSSKDSLLQESSVHTSCSQNLFLKDKFGSVQLLIFENEFGLFTCFVGATYSYTLSNEAAANAGAIVEFTSTTNGVSDDCLDDLPAPGVIPPDTTIVVDKEILIDMTVRQTYDTTVFVRAETPGGATCSDTATLSFTSGNPNLPSFGKRA
eukprot:CAMPEP_0181040420 /NCGR_PEP_ID=MMETSP1070-20121207/11038_1 /TAXON_ID=265543 /ORGANISM="Minutocellus polymorphus, Strain NH13" /LENGTH=936 /DNA_ID=CAMNT_0023118427 /DNA_START=14 /DNA_END=2824 /DNA_ORIENTATION=+